MVVMQAIKATRKARAPVVKGPAVRPATRKVKVLAVKVPAAKATTRKVKVRVAKVKKKKAKVAAAAPLKFLHT